MTHIIPALVPPARTSHTGLLGPKGSWVWEVWARAGEDFCRKRLTLFVTAQRKREEVKPRAEQKSRLACLEYEREAPGG